MRTDRKRSDENGQMFPKDRRPPAKPAGKWIFISDSGATPTVYPVFSDADGQWRKFSDNTVVS